MAMTYDIKFEATGAERAMRMYPKQTQRATMRALNRALTSGRATMARLVSKDMGLKVGATKEAIRIRKAHAGSLQIRLAASLVRLPLIHFGARQTARGVSYKIGARGRNRIANAFIATVKGPLPTGVVSPGHVGVFVRRTRARLPIDQRYGPSIGRVFSLHREAGIAQMREVFIKNLAHELKFAQSEDAGA